MDTDSKIVKAPFSREQVESLNGYQRSGVFHEFTCDTDHCRTPLFAEEKGWRCPLCGYTQDWAHLFMADGSWKAQRDLIDRVRKETL